MYTQHAAANIEEKKSTSRPKEPIQHRYALLTLDFAMQFSIYRICWTVRSHANVIKVSGQPASNKRCEMVQKSATNCRARIYRTNLSFYWVYIYIYTYDHLCAHITFYTYTLIFQKQRKKLWENIEHWISLCLVDEHRFID